MGRGSWGHTETVEGRHRLKTPQSSSWIRRTGRKRCVKARTIVFQKGMRSNCQTQQRAWERQEPGRHPHWIWHHLPEQFQQPAVAGSVLSRLMCKENPSQERKRTMCMEAWTVLSEEVHWLSPRSHNSLYFIIFVKSSYPKIQSMLFKLRNLIWLECEE